MTTAYSFTAPRFTKEDDERERANLITDEAHQIAIDIHGKHSILAENEELKVRCRLQLQEAIQGIPEEQKQSYLRAVELCPELVEQESDPLKFLRCDDYNVWAAACRLIKYWEIRNKIFGERGFLPMVMTGHGALTEEDVTGMDVGATLLLGSYTQGQTVLLHDKSRLDGHPDTPAVMLRCVFYMISVALESETCQLHGFIILVNNRGLALNNFDRKYGKLLIEMLQSCLPMKTRSLHLIAPRIKNAGDYIYPILLYLCGKNVRRRCVFHAFQPDDRELVADLETFGLKSKMIPDYLGGTFKIAQFNGWIEERLALELRREQTETVRERNEA